jgi:hypothetical protein
MTVTDTLDGQDDSETFVVNVSDPPVNASGGFIVETNIGTDTGPRTLATFTDPGGAEPNVFDPTPATSAGHYKATVDWADGTTSAGIITPLFPSSPTQPFTVTASHTYTIESPVGGFNVAITIDHEGVISTANSTAIVGRPGKVTGGGQIGQIGTTDLAFAVQPDGHGGFKGSLNYKDKTSNMDVTGTSITFVSILIDNAHATIKGTATVNGVSGYTFRVDMEDNGEPGKGHDRFRIRLDGPSTFDSNSAAPNGGLLSAGNTQVHK